MRRVVTGHKGETARFLSDGPPTFIKIFTETPGMATAMLWSTPPLPTIGPESAAETVSAATSLLPAVGETRLIYLQIPPVSVMMAPEFDPVAAGKQFVELDPEMAALMEPDSPGMHRTETIDYVIVLDGEVYLELDDGQEALLKRTDVVIQCGARHAWHNRGDTPVLLAVVLIGADRNA